MPNQMQKTHIFIGRKGKIGKRIMTGMTIQTTAKRLIIKFPSETITEKMKISKKKLTQQHRLHKFFYS